jgi:glutamate-1-semialdehyde 2,1-aminomutase
LINRNHLAKLTAREEERFLKLHPKSGELFEKAKQSMPGGVPMSLLTRPKARALPMLTAIHILIFV